VGFGGADIGAKASGPPSVRSLPRVRAQAAAPSPCAARPEGCGRVPKRSSTHERSSSPSGRRRLRAASAARTMTVSSQLGGAALRDELPCDALWAAIDRRLNRFAREWLLPRGHHAVTGTERRMRCYTGGPGTVRRRTDVRRPRRNVAHDLIRRTDAALDAALSDEAHEVDDGGDDIVPEDRTRRDKWAQSRLGNEQRFSPD
jgi:hypothetical protein